MPRLLEHLGERYAEVLAQHRRLLRTAFRESGGEEVDTQGDAFFVAFARAKDALLAAVAAQRAITAHRWPAGVSVRVRMGLQRAGHRCTFGSVDPPTAGSIDRDLDLHRLVSDPSGQASRKGSRTRIAYHEVVMPAWLLVVYKHRRSSQTPRGLKRMVEGPNPSSMWELRSRLK